MLGNWTLPPGINNPQTGHIFVWLVVVSVLTCWLTNTGLDQSEGEYHFQVARQIVREGRLGFDQEMTGIYTKAPNGITYASHEIGNTLLNLPLAWLCETFIPAKAELAGRLLRSVQAGLVMALVLGLAFIITVRHLRAESGVAVASCLLMLGTSYLLHYGHDGFDGCLCALLWMAALLCHLEYLRDARLRMLGLMAALGGAAVITRISMVLPMGLLCVAALFSDMRRVPWKQTLARGLTIMGSLLPFMIWQMGYNHLRTGSVWTSPVQTAQYQVANGLDGDLFTGLTGLLFSPGKSLLLFAPLLVVAFAGLPEVWRRHRLLTVHIIATLILWLLLHGRIRSWYGAWGWGPRYFVTILPVLMLPLPLVLGAWWKSHALRPVLLGLVIWGTVLQGANIVSSYHYRLRYAENQGWLQNDDFIWNPRRNQVSDILGAALRNLQVMKGELEPVVARPSDSIGVWTANTLNHWTVRAYLIGAPLWMIIGIVSVNGMMLVVCIQALCRSLRCEKTASNHGAETPVLS